MSGSTGIFCQRSEIGIHQITDGTTNTYLVGEKYLNPDHYATGMDPSDDHSLLNGDDFDFHSWTDRPPIQDRAGLGRYHSFGSAHPGVWNVALCDGSVRSVGYEIDVVVHRNMGNRADGQAVDTSRF